MNSLSWNDMVFSNRNQSYGAYLLRKAYPGRVTMSFVLAMVTVSMLLASPMIKKMFGEEVIANVRREPKIITELQPPPVFPDIPPPTVDLKPLKKLAFTPPRVTDKNVVDEIPDIDEIKAQPTVGTDDGNTTYTFTEPVVEVVTPVVNDKETIRTFVEIQPEFPGGYQAMMKFIGENTKYPSIARRMGTEGTAFISFVVDSDGTIDDVQVARGLSAECDKEAMRVISKMPLWKPGRQSGQAVKVRFILPFKFKLEH